MDAEDRIDRALESLSNRANIAEYKLKRIKKEVEPYQSDYYASSFLVDKILSIINED